MTPWRDRSGGGGGKIEFPSWNLIGIILTWALQIYSYFGILHQATLTSSSKSKKDLVGGQHLDWLGLTLVVQFSTALHSTKWFWLLLIWPIVSGWSLYTSVFGKSSPKSSSSNMPENSTSASNSNSNSSNSSRREKRAEKRRQKWS